MHDRILITGGAGFIGANLVYQLVSAGRRVHVVDKLTYAGNLDSIARNNGNPLFSFAQIDVCDESALAAEIFKFSPAAIVHLAAESHVDRSIDGPSQFVATNVSGTLNLLMAARGFWMSLPGAARDAFRLVHVSTDEVYGSLSPQDAPFTEASVYDPRSPYAASKAASDHLVRAWFHTYGFPTIVTNCSNNYGPYQFPEKLFPVVVLKALRQEPIPIYGTGANIRDWLFVGDHVEALSRLIDSGRPGETYNIGGGNEITNLELVQLLCSQLDHLRPHSKSYCELIEFVSDRPGHDFRYAIDATKIKVELGWSPRQDFSEGCRQTVVWYLDNERWWRRILSGEYKMQRQGLGNVK